MSNLTQARLRELLTYEPETGLFRWRIQTPHNKYGPGTIAGSNHKRTGCCIRIDHQGYAAHRLVWLYVRGRWPNDQIDHINGDRFDNRFCNLREADGYQNAANRGPMKNNTSGAKGVVRKGSKFIAQIKVRGKQISLGTFPSIEEASAAYVAAARKYFGEFARSA